MRRSRQVVLAITGSVVLAACDRTGAPRPQLVSAVEPAGRGAGSEVVELAPEPGSGSGTASSTNPPPPSSTRSYSGGHTYFYPGYRPTPLLGSSPIPADGHAASAGSPSSREPSAPSSAASAASHGSVSRGGFGSSGSSHASAAS